MEEIGEVDGFIGDQPYRSLLARRDGGGLVENPNSRHYLSGRRTRKFVKQGARQVAEAKAPMDEIVAIMSPYRHATEVGAGSSASWAAGYKKKNLDGVMKLGWGGCIELAEITARVANGSKRLKAFVIEVDNAIFGGHSVVYFPETDWVFDPSLHESCPAKEYFDRNVLGLLK